jgi:hypothetical protein
MADGPAPDWAAPGSLPGPPSPGAADLIERITRGDLDADLPHLALVIGHRLRLVGAATAAAALARFRVGDRVRINHTVKPAYLHNRCGVVAAVTDQQVVVCLDEPVGRFTAGHVGCPPLALQRLGPE